MPDPAVTVVIPVYNRVTFTRQCLDRIERNTPATPPYDVVVVDNGSTDGTREFFRDPQILDGRLSYHRNETNLGFAKANNIGARLARGEYLLFLNNDTLVQPRWLEEMVKVLQAG